MRKTYAIREVVQVSGEVNLYFANSREKSVILKLLDSCPDPSFEESVLTELDCKKGDHVEFFLSCRVVKKSKKSDRT